MKKNKNSPDELMEAGYKSENFAYKIGGGEDENDMTIFVKDNTAVRIVFNLDYYPSGFCFSCDYDRLSTVNGWDYNNEVPFYL